MNYNIICKYTINCEDIYTFTTVSVRDDTFLSLLDNNSELVDFDSLEEILPDIGKSFVYVTETQEVYLSKVNYHKQITSANNDFYTLDELMKILTPEEISQCEEEDDIEEEDENDE